MFMGHGEGQFKNVDKHQANILLNQPLYLSNSYLPLQTSASNLLSILVNQCLFVWLCCRACGILVSQPGVETVPLQ